MANSNTITSAPINPSWRDTDFNENLQRPDQNNPRTPDFIGGANFDALLDDMLFNRMIRLRNIPAAQFPQSSDPGKIFWDKDNKKYKLYVDGTSKFVDLLWTSTSTSTTSSSSTSTSTSSSSTSTTTT